MEHLKERMITEIEAFDLPGYKEIPNVGLFLEQTAKYIAEYLSPLDNVTLTGSMISNYVKQRMIKNPVKKQYDREQIAYLFFIAIAKSVLSLEDIKLLMKLQQETYSIESAYEYFREELKAVLLYVFDMNNEKNELADFSARNMDEKSLMRSTAITIAHKVYLAKYFRFMREDAESGAV